jgi:hypothetical protein
MIKFLDEAVCAFRKCFSRKAAFKWFVTIVIGIMVRTDKLGGVTSVIRSLGLAPAYDRLIRFFRSDAWDLKDMERTWQEFVMGKAPLVKVGGSVVIVGDGVKVSKEGKRMPAVKRLHQESENSSKPSYISGLMYGCVGVLAEKSGKTYCIPLACEVQDGMREIISWSNTGEERQGSHVEEMITLAHKASDPFGDTVVLLDRYFLTVPALMRLSELNSNDRNMHAIIMAKCNAVAYEDPPLRLPGARGRPRLKGKAIKLAGLFDTNSGLFQTVDTMLYGQKKRVRYLAVDYLWGKRLYRKLRFVLVEMDGNRSIIACTNLTFDPVDIISLYARRFTIECTFKSMKQDVAAFSNRFWTLDIPKLNRYAKSTEPDRAVHVKEKRARKNVRKAFDASEGYVFCGIVALGLLQMLALTFFSGISTQGFRYLRTPSKSVPSEVTVAAYLRKNIFWLLSANADLTISRIIIEKMAAIDDDFDCWEAI